MKTAHDYWFMLDSAVAAIHRTVYDEVSLLFSKPAELEDFKEWAVAQGLEHFNSVQRDQMVRQDKAQAFGVRFEFLRLPNRPWRIEAMCILEGCAPLHEEALRRSGEGCVVHLSYKCRDLQTYQEHVRSLWDEGRIKKAEYRNSYGMFSYWVPTGSELRPFLKPRVNLRDSADPTRPLADE